MIFRDKREESLSKKTNDKKTQGNRLPKLRLKTEPFDWSTGSDLILQQQIMALQKIKK